MILFKSKIADEIKRKNVIDMGLTFTAMIRVFEKGSKSKIAGRLFKEFGELSEVRNKDDFVQFHEKFCKWFTSSIKTAQRIRNGRIVKHSRYTSYGHASKVLDVSLKVFVYYAGLPDADTSKRLLPFLNSAVDTPILGHLKGSFPNENIIAKTVEKIDASSYKKLQELVSHDISLRFKKSIMPVQYDDIMWNFFNRNNKLV